MDKESDWNSHEVAVGFCMNSKEKEWRERKRITAAVSMMESTKGSHTECSFWKLGYIHCIGVIENQGSQYTDGEEELLAR